MAKYIIYTTWYHKKGLRSVAEMRDGMRKNVKPLSIFTICLYLSMSILPKSHNFQPILTFN